MRDRRFWFIFLVFFAQFCLVVGIGSPYAIVAEHDSSTRLSTIDKKQLAEYQKHIDRLSEIKFRYNDEILTIPLKDIHFTVDFTGIEKDLSANKEVSVDHFSFDQKLVQDRILEWAKSFNKQPVNAMIEQKDQEIHIIKESLGSELNLAATLELFYDHLTRFDLFDPISVETSTIEPTITAKNLSEIQSVLGQYKTEYDTSKTDRSINVELATKRLNGTILAPNETFSFVKETGPYSLDEGYQLATIMKDYSFEEGSGGGVCQVSSTLYMAALTTQLEIVERHHHQRPVSYIPKGYDATVNQENLDLRLKNQYDFPIYIQAHAEEGNLMVQIFGSETGNNPSIYLKDGDQSEIPFEVIFQSDALVPLGKPQIKKEGRVGYKIKINRIIVENGTERTELISEDTYLPITEIILHHPNEKIEELKQKFSHPGELG